MRLFLLCICFLTIINSSNNFKTQGLLGFEAAKGLRLDGSSYLSYCMHAEWFISGNLFFTFNYEYQNKLSGERSLVLPLFLIHPSGISYHIPLTSKLDISPYFNFMELDWLWNKSKDYRGINIPWSFGLKASFWASNGWLIQGSMKFSTNVDYDVSNVFLYEFNGWRSQIGLGLSYNFGVDLDFPGPKNNYREEKKTTKQEKVIEKLNYECLLKYDRIDDSDVKLDEGNIEIARFVKKEAEAISKLPCYFSLKDYQKGRLEMLYQQARKILNEQQNNYHLNQKKYAEIGGLQWDNYNSILTIDNNGIDLSYASNIEQWKSLCDKDQPAYCYYNFVDTNSSLGLIYNYAAVRVLAPEGYHVPSKKDYEVLLEELKRTKQTNTLCSIIPISDCNICYSCTANDYDTQLNFNLKPFGWLSVSKSKKYKWKENGEDIYLWTLEIDRKNSLLSGLGFAQFKSPSTIKIVDLNEINNVGAKGNNVKNKEDFEFIEKYFGTFIRFVKN